jgi:hypothetical protein
MKINKYIFQYIIVLLITVFTRQIISQDAVFPRAFGVAIDDIGWNHGSSQGDEGGPWRAGVRRDMNIKDYMPIVEIGKAVGVRFLGVFVLCEMDRKNVCANYPTTTIQGSKYDNTENVKDEQLEIMNYVKDNSAYFEFGLHGVGHEHFDNGIRTRAEWYDLQHHKPWTEQDSRDHLKCFTEIMSQYGITKENGQSFPESFVPCAYGYYWNPDGDLSTGKLMSEAGVKYVNTLFEEIPESNPPIEFGGGFDHGVLVINRYNYGNEWFKLGTLPSSPLEEYKSDIIETHWPNWLAQDYFLQGELNQQWIDYFKNIQKSKTHYLAKNTEQLFSQWLYNRYSKVNITQGKIEIDNTNMPQVVYDKNLLGNMVIKVQLNDGMHVSKALINGKPVSAYFEDEGYGFIYLPVLKKEHYKVIYKLGIKTQGRYVNNTGTYNIYDVKNESNEFSFSMKMYGIQQVKVICENPSKIESDNPNLKVNSYNYDKNSGTLMLEIYGRNMQGEKGTISLTF